MKHEVLHLNPRRTYVRVGETWYDTHVELSPKVGQRFLTGFIEEILDYETYTKTYPESKEEIHPYINEKTISRGYIRKIVNGEVKYAVNPATPKEGSLID